MRSEIHLLIYTQWSFFSPKRLWKGDRVVSTAWSYKNIYVCLNLSHRCYALLFHFQLKCVFSCVIRARVWPFLISVIHSSQNTEHAYILYNDQRPPVDSGDRWIHNSGSSGGHTKGERKEQSRSNTCADQRGWTMPKQKCHLNQAYYTPYTVDLDTTSIWLYGEVHFKTRHANPVYTLQVFANSS